MRQLSNVVQHKINISTSKSFNSLYACRVNSSIKFQGLGSCFRTSSVLSWRPRRILTVPVLWLTWTLYSHYVYGRLCNSPINKEMEGILFMKWRAFCKELRSTHTDYSHTKSANCLLVCLELISPLDPGSKVNYYNTWELHNPGTKRNRTPLKLNEALYDVVPIWRWAASVRQYMPGIGFNLNPLNLFFFIFLPCYDHKCSHAYWKKLKKNRLIKIRIN